MSANPKSAAEYLKADDIGLVIAKGMAVTYRAQPRNPIDYFGRWLLNQSQVARNQLLEEEKALKKKEIADRHAVEVRAKERAADAKAAAEAEHTQKLDDFAQKVKDSKDLEYELPALAEHLQHFTGATAVYIGKVVLPKKKIKEDDNDQAHEDPSAEPMIQFTHSTEGHDFLIDKTLKQEEGITYGLFRDGEGEEPDAAEEEKEEPEEGEDGEAKPAKPAKEKLPKHILVPEVVREDRIHYYDVPKLGSYLAVKLEYESCLSEAAFDAALANYIEVEHQRAEQAKEKEAWLADQAQKRADAEEAGEEFAPEERDFPEIQYAEYKTSPVRYCVCLNTMGQDREFTEEQKLLALRTVQAFRDRWEALEKENLLADVTAKLDRSEGDAVYKEKYEDVDKNELQRIVDEAVASAAPADGEDAMPEDERGCVGLKAKFVQVTRTLHAPDLAAQHKAKVDRMQKEQMRSGGGERAASAMGSAAGSQADTRSLPGGQYFPLHPEQWKEKLTELKQLSVTKFPRIWQSVFYLLRYRERQFLCERDTNKLLWKKAKLNINEDFFTKLGDYWPIGAKEDAYKEYEKFAFIKQNIEGITEEQVDDYSVALGKLYRWLLLAIETRTENVRLRRLVKKNAKADRDAAIEREKARVAKREELFEQKKEEFDKRIDDEIAARKEAGEEVEDDEYRPEFDKEEFMLKFDEENFPEEIPDEVIDDIDNDFNVEIVEEPVDE